MAEKVQMSRQSAEIATQLINAGLNFVDVITDPVYKDGKLSGTVVRLTKQPRKDSSS